MPYECQTTTSTKLADQKKSGFKSWKRNNLRNQEKIITEMSANDWVDLCEDETVNKMTIRKKEKLSAHQKSWWKIVIIWKESWVGSVKERRENDLKGGEKLLKIRQMLKINMMLINLSINQLERIAESSSQE